MAPSRSGDPGRAASRVREGRVAVETALLESGAKRVSGAQAGEARRWDAQLLVVGSHGRRGLEYLLLGSMAEGVARTAPVPVLIARGR
jgi:nucleotide-binding universal stress UspA family protein